MNGTAKIHVGYIIGILIALNIATLTVKWGAIQDVASYVSFAATLASLLLSILAIVYSYISSGSLASQADRIAKAGDELDNARHEIHVATDHLRMLKDSLPVEFKLLGEKVAETHEAVQILARSNINKRPKTGEDKKDTKSSLAYLVSHSSPNGLIAMLCACEASSAKQPISFGEEAIGPTTWDTSYIYGWLMALDAMELIELKREGEAGLKVVHVPPNLPPLLDAEIAKRAADDEQNEAIKNVYTELVIESDRIKQFFKRARPSKTESPS